MSLTFDYVYTKKEEYSEFETQNRVIDVVVYYDQVLAAQDDSFTVQIIKAKGNRDSVVATGSYTFPSDPTTNFVTVSINLKDARDSSNIRLARRGMYFAKVVDDSLSTNYEESPEFRISLITSETMKERWLHGLTLKSSDILSAKYQPQQVTGVEILEVTQGHPAASFMLHYEKKDNKHFLNWAHGQSIEISATHPIYPLKEYFLPGENGAAGITILVDPNILPSSDVTESIIIEASRMDDDRIREFVDQAADLLENVQLQIFLEPTVCVSEISTEYAHGGITSNDDYDKITTAISYYGVTPNHWVDVKFPFQYLLKVDYLTGAIAGNEVVNIDEQWIEISYHSGYVQLVPLHLEMVFNYLGLIWAPELWGVRDLPNFWHYRARAGLREVPGDLLELLGRTAAISILSVAGQAYKGGMAAQSVSRDGLSSSISFTSSAMYGIYSAYINDHKTWVETHLPALINKYRGIVNRVM